MGSQQTILSYKILVKNSSVLNEEDSTYEIVGTYSPAIAKKKKNEIETALHFLNVWFKLVLENAEEPETKLPTSAGSWKKQESSRKISISALLTMPKPLTVWITINCGQF